MCVCRSIGHAMGTTWAMEWARDGDLLRPVCVLVAPAEQHTLVTKDETIALIPSGSVPPYASRRTYC